MCRHVKLSIFSKLVCFFGPDPLGTLLSNAVFANVSTKDVSSKDLRMGRCKMDRKFQRDRKAVTDLDPDDKNG